MSNFQQVINRYREQSHSEADKGKRFERLMQAMLHTRRDLSIQAIAGLLGFADQATFSRYFRREASQSPTDFREAQEQLQEK